MGTGTLQSPPPKSSTGGRTSSSQANFCNVPVISMGARSVLTALLVRGAADRWTGWPPQRNGTTEQKGKPEPGRTPVHPVRSLLAGSSAAGTGAGRLRRRGARPRAPPESTEAAGSPEAHATSGGGRTHVDGRGRD